MPNAEIITIGDELVSGETVDTSSSELDKKLETLGWVVTRHTTVRDVEDEIAEVMRAAAARAGLVICSGGLGPTEDDVTLAALAKAMGVGLMLHQPTLEAIAARFRSFGREMTPNNERQARVPERGDVIPNPVGTAPSFRGYIGETSIYLLPGVPREMRWLFDNAIAPQISKGAPAVLRRTIRVMGLGESRLEHDIRAVVKTNSTVRFGYRTLGAENHVKLAAEGPNASEALAKAEKEVTELLGDRVFGFDHQDLPTLLGELLESRGHTIAAAESCTGGMVLELLTDRPGSSKYVLGGFVTYSNEAKVSLLGVSSSDIATQGAVSELVARQMAEGARAKLGSTWGLSATGIAGPSGGTAEKPVGLVWIAVAGESGTEAKELRLPGDRAQIRRGTALSVLDLLRRRL